MRATNCVLRLDGIKAVSMGHFQSRVSGILMECLQSLRILAGMSSCDVAAYAFNSSMAFTFYDVFFVKVDVLDAAWISLFNSDYSLLDKSRIRVTENIITISFIIKLILVQKIVQ